MGALLVKSGREKGTRLVLPDNKKVVIGHDPVCDIRIPSRQVSNIHCTVRSSFEGVFVTDMDSENGTLINGVPIREETPLKPGDLLKVGPLVLECVSPTHPAAAGSQHQTDAAATTEDDVLDWLSADADSEETNGGKASQAGASGKESAVRRRSYRHILIKDVSDAAVVYLANPKRVSARNYEQAVNELFALVEGDGYRRIVLNLSDVEYIHSTALGNLAKFAARLKAVGGELRLCNLHPVLRELFEAAAYGDQFDIRDDEPSALRGFS